MRPGCAGGVLHYVMSGRRSHAEDVGVDTLPQAEHTAGLHQRGHGQASLLLARHTVRVRSVSLTCSSLMPASRSVSPSSMCPPGGTQIPGNVLMCLALLVTRTSPSRLSRMTTTPTLTPRWTVEAGSRDLSAGLRQCIGQKGGWVNRDAEAEDGESLDNINLFSLRTIMSIKIYK